ncbi:MAG: hypothetical protein IJD79_01975 [Clostridia bacterium]|nr:hypothetical protein [Clostridia bacterium]
MLTDKTTTTVREGNGSEENPYRSPDKTAGIQTQLAALASRGGLLNLESARYDIEKSIVLDTSSLALDGGVWACNTDPNGVFETKFGTKIRMQGTNFPAIVIGRETDPVSGAIIRNVGIQGDITGMDTRRIVNFDEPRHAAGLCLDTVRTDQCAFTKLSLCGLANGIVATGNAEIDACIFESINMDGCGNGIWFSPGASYYVRVRSCIIADNPYYGFYLGGRGKSIHNLEILDSHFVRNGGAFRDGDGHPPAAVYFDGVSKCAISHCLFDDPGTFWYYDDNATSNEERQPSHIKIPALRIEGNENRICGNTFRNSSSDSIILSGNGNILMNTIADGNVRISGKGNTVATLVFTKPSSRLILEGEARDTTVILGVEESRIVRIID